MKNLKSILIVVSILFISCSENDSNESIIQNSDTNLNLVSITRQLYSDNNLYYSSKFNFDNEKLIDIQHSNGSYEEFYYEGHLVYQILDFNDNNDLEWTTTYTYDDLGRLTQKKVVPSPNNTLTDVSRQKDITYQENLIQIAYSWSDGGFHKKTISLDNENLIIDDKQFSKNDILTIQRKFEYLNKNFIKQTIVDLEGTIEYEETYNYLDKVISKPYNYNIYLFGPHWKNNSALNIQFGLGQVDPYKISENYVKDYQYTSYLTNSTRTGTFDYEFDLNDNLIKQTENNIWSTETGVTEYKIIKTFVYE